MNSDDFEKRLERQTFRPIPGEWRRKILQAAEISVAAPQRNGAKIVRLFQPHPGWAALAAVWLVIVALNFSQKESVPAESRIAAKPEDVQFAIHQRQLLFAELNSSQSIPAAEPPKDSQPRPHSALRPNICAA
ncbi:MAG: hypothetical protein ABI042_19135 [Verrucomicrobiota bacterium]